MNAGSLRIRLLMGASAFLVCAMAIASIALSLLFERHVKDWIDAELTNQIDQLIAGIDRDQSGALAVQTKPADPRFDRPLSGHYWQAEFEASGKLERSPSLWDATIATGEPAAVASIARHHRVSGPAGKNLYVLEKRVELPARLGKERIGVIAAIDEAEVQRAVANFRTSLTPFLLVLGALLAAAAWIQVQLGLRPLASVRDRIAAIRSGHARRLGDDFPEEVQPLSREVDTLLDARDRQIETARARAADLAHGLNTPIQVLIGGIARLKAKGETAIAGDLSEAASAIERHVERQLAKARLKTSGGPVTARVAETAKRVAKVVRKTPAGERLQWEFDIADGVYARIHPDDLAEALGGLIENAARHAATRVVLSLQTQPGKVLIRVSDDGPGIPPEAETDVLTRGYRLDTSSTDSGLGLAIAADIAEAWGGHVTFERDSGLFTVVLCLQSADGPVSTPA